MMRDEKGICDESRKWMRTSVTTIVQIHPLENKQIDNKPIEKYVLESRRIKSLRRQHCHGRKTKRKKR